MKYLAIIILLWGCVSEVEFSEEGGRVYLKNLHPEVLSAEDVIWKVGKKKEISKGFLVKIGLPTIKENSARALYNKGANAWLVKVSRQSGFDGYKVIGYVEAPFSPSKRGRRTKSVHFINKVFFQVYYPAAAAISYFYAYCCPGMDHRRRLGEIKVQGQNLKPRDAYVYSVKSFSEKTKKNEIVPAVFNGGRNLAGKYNVEIALYNTSRSMIMSSFIPVDGSIHITSESDISVRECDGFQLPGPNERKRKSYKDFRFGQKNRR